MSEPMNSLRLPISIADVLGGKSVEWERLEYKQGWNPEAVLHSICAFANDFHNLGGGYIVVGVAEEAGRPVLPPAGLDPDTLDAIQKELLNLGYSSIQPMVHPLSAPCVVDGKWIFVIWVPGGETRPYKAKRSLSQTSNDWDYYIRRHSSTVRATGADEQELISLAATVPFDDRYNQQASLDDLSPRLIKEFLREVGSELADEVESLSPEALGRQMNIVGGPSEAVFPKNAGLLFFNDDPRGFFPATQIDVVWFPAGAGGDRFEEKTFFGPLSRMTREALDLTEGRSTGIPKILRNMAANGSPAPEFETDDDRLSYLVRLPAHPHPTQLGPKQEPSRVQVGTKSELSRHQVSGGQTQQVSSKYPASTQQVTRQVKMLLEATHAAMSRAELMDALSLKDRVNFSQKYLEPALLDGLVEMTQPDSPKSPTQKYRLTEKGRIFLENQ